MPKGEYSRPANRRTKEISKTLKPSGDPKTTLTAAHYRKRKNNDIMDKIPVLGKRTKAGSYNSKTKKK